MRWSSIDECVLYQVGTVHNVRVESILPVENKSIPPYMDYDIKDNPMEENFTECIEETMEEINIDRIGFNGDKAKLILPDGYEFKTEDNEVYVVKKKPQYPKTYEECCEVLSIPSYYCLRCHTFEHGYHELATSKKLVLLQDNLNKLSKLLICRNAYWKIAGEEMGLEKPWEPDYDSGVNKYGIICMNGVVQKSNPTTNWERHLNKVLDFPTEEMRNIFYENFKDWIEDCKELL